jgi:hypothetical protein
VDIDFVFLHFFDPIRQPEEMGGMAVSIIKFSKEYFCLHCPKVPARLDIYECVDKSNMNFRLISLSLKQYLGP